MDKILFFIFNGMTDYEITFLSHLLNSDGDKEILTVAYEEGLIKGKSGFTYKPDMLLRDVSLEDTEGLIIPGGWYGDAREDLLGLISALYINRKLIGGICGAGTVFLAKSGILNNVKYTTPVTEWTDKHVEVFGEKDPFPRYNYVERRVMRDGNVITAQGTAFIDLSIEICDWFNLFEDEQEKENFRRTFCGL